ncbi:MAG: Rpn family recombination-promoting nuclease/putative transposase [Candidatus Electrothrix sp. Rat3]|nr:Rpn family recombination-promoting nuclease/putative transposase [Candidatus Electrothrix rattekaaiensis]
MASKERYINLFTDYGFKKIFGEEPNKNLLLDFLNELLKEEQGEIRDLTYLKTEQLGDTDIDRKAIFDLYCENERGEKFIVELQKSKQNFFKDRALYYSTFPIREQAERGDWNFQLKAVYTVAILDFVFDEDKNQPEKYRYDVKLSDIETNRVFYDKLTFIYLEMPKFSKKLDELKTRFDKWLYVIRNLNRLERIPDMLREQVFEQLFDTAEIARFTPDQVRSYEKSLKYYRDMKNSLDTAFDEGRVEGKEEGKNERDREIVRNGIQQGIDIKMIAQLTGLSEEEIKEIEKERSDD